MVLFLLAAGTDSGLDPAGLGRTVALAAEGATVATTARNESALGSLTEKLAGLGVRAAALPADAASEQDVERVRRRVLESLGVVFAATQGPKSQTFLIGLRR